MGGPDEIKETEYQKELAKIAQEKWQMAKDYLQPLEDDLIAEHKKGITPEMRSKVEGAATVSHQKTFAEAGKQAETQLAASGVDPTSGKYQESLRDISRAGAESRAAAGVEGEAGLQSQHLSTGLNLLRAGAGEATTAQAGLTDVAGRAAQKAEHQASMAWQKQEGLRELAGTGIGVAAGYYGRKKTPEDFDKQHAEKFGLRG